MIIKKCKYCNYREILLNEEDEIPEVNNDEYVRISSPSDVMKLEKFQRNNFIFIDRTIEVKVPLKKSAVEFQEKVRMRIEKSSDYNSELYEIALNNFLDDSRFYITYKEEREKLAEQIMREWVKEIVNPFVCIYKGKVVGFADVRMLDEYNKKPFIYLAVVDRKYRLTGAAVSLYSYICQYYKEQGEREIYGRVSSKNTAVVNLYSSLGGQFSKPWDIYIK